MNEKKETSKKWAESDSEVIKHIEDEIKGVKESIGGLKGKPEFASETKALEAEVMSLEATVGEMKAPEITKAEQMKIDEMSKGVNDILKAISGEKLTLQQLRAKGLTIPGDIKRRLIGYGQWLLSLQRWLLWVAGFWWLPGWLRSTLRDYARAVSEIGNLLIWIASIFC